MKFRCSEAEISEFSERMDERRLPYTVERDSKGRYLVTELNEEEFAEVTEEQ